jgi:hypothetical protein
MDKLSLITMIMLFIITGCERNYPDNSIVFDAKSKMPLDSVEYTDVGNAENNIYYTDSTGNYNTENIMICPSMCPELIVKFSKSGYKSQTIQDPSRRDVYLEKE